MTVEIKYTQLFIDNEFQDAEKGSTFDTINPATEEVIAKVAFGSKGDIDKAVIAARRAFDPTSEWRTMDASNRGRLMYKLADVMERDRIILAKLDTVDNGKPYSTALEDVEGSIGVIRYYAGYADKIHGSTIPVDGNFFTYTRQEPVGVVGQIIPWNYPVAMISWKWGPALATGCTMVLKPAEQTPLSALYMAALTKEVGFPKGVINVVTGDGQQTGAALSQHMDVDKIAFTGSTEVGKLITSNASNLKRVSLELGGKSPLVVMNDCPSLDEAVQICHDAIFANMGQNCCAGSRTFVQSDIYEEFVKKSSELVKKKKIGCPWDSQTDYGPQVSKEHMGKILDLINSGVKEDNMRIAKEEIFGPVQSIFVFETLDEVISRANSTPYGLAAGILTQKLDNITKFTQNIRAGSVWVNCYDYLSPQTPFGGFKQSGYGRELGPEGIKCYLESKTVTMATASKCS
ncbi:ALDH [Lepeophtheirus salmonis]|uniref:ALDH n=1 Tax=Lepeophtheirus salmonis TaxID=72036 RepID=A0A7R8H1S4_LEPSM|nr:ALDH [Lepeophtheirus salmonis]CAF2812582.1 ALDH [Lepeophtheirus salmonis]